MEQPKKVKAFIMSIICIFSTLNENKCVVRNYGEGYDQSTQHGVKKSGIQRIGNGIRRNFRGISYV